MSLQSRWMVVVRGNPGEKIPTGTRFRLWSAQRMLRRQRTPSKHRWAPRSPSESFLLPSPGRLSTGLKTQRRLSPRPSSSEADCLFRQVRGGYCRGHYVLPIAGSLSPVYTEITTDTLKFNISFKFSSVLFNLSGLVKMLNYL